MSYLRAGEMAARKKRACAILDNDPELGPTVLAERLGCSYGAAAKMKTNWKKQKEEKGA